MRSVAAKSLTRQLVLTIEIQIDENLDGEEEIFKTESLATRE